LRYLPEIRVRDRICFPTRELLAAELGELRVTPVPIPHDCTDGFLGAWWRRPEAYLDPAVRASISGFARIPREQEEAAMARLRRDLESGEWERLYGHLAGVEELDLGYRIVAAELT
jgi:hypothetical protein